MASRSVPHIRAAAPWVAGSFGVAAAAYATYVGLTWRRYGHPRRPSPSDYDALLDRFMPTYDVVERHHVRVAAPADVTLATATEMELQQSAIIRAVFKARELVLGAEPDTAIAPRELLAHMKWLGWRELAHVRGREIVMGAVTQPWLPNVIFRGLSPDEFSGFCEPGYVKIIWTLRTDPLSVTDCIFRSETRAVATDAFARAKFRWYWSFLSPGIWLIRRLTLIPIKAEAERRATATPL